MHTELYTQFHWIFTHGNEKHRLWCSTIMDSSSRNIELIRKFTGRSGCQWQSLCHLAFWEVLCNIFISFLATKVCYLAKTMIYHKLYSMLCPCTAVLFTLLYTMLRPYASALKHSCIPLLYNIYQYRTYITVLDVI